MPLDEPDQKTLTIKDSQVQDQIQVSTSSMTLINPSGVSAWDSVTSMPVQRFMFSFGSIASRLRDRIGLIQVECSLGCSHTHSCTRAVIFSVCMECTACDIMLYASMIFHERGETSLLIVSIIQSQFTSTMQSSKRNSHTGHEACPTCCARPTVIHLCPLSRLLVVFTMAGGSKTQEIMAVRADQIHWTGTQPFDILQHFKLRRCPNVSHCCQEN